MAVAPRYRELMRVCHIQDIGGSTCREGVGAQGDYGQTRKSVMELLFIFSKLLPLGRAQPKCVATDPDALVAFRQRGIEFCTPTADNVLRIRSSIGEIPFTTGENLDAPCMLVESGNALAQRNPRL